MIGFVELDELLLSVEAEISAAECHGFLCGQVCVTDFPMEDLWQEFIDAQSNNDARVESCYTEIRALLADIIDNIQSPNMDFQLILPDEDSTLGERVNALAEWCHGFLNGYGVSAGNLNNSLSEETREVLEDFTRICRVSIDEETDDEDEQAFMELIEYIRMGTIMIYDEISFFLRSSEAPEVIH